MCCLKPDSALKSCHNATRCWAAGAAPPLPPPPPLNLSIPLGRYRLGKSADPAVTAKSFRMWSPAAGVAQASNETATAAVGLRWWVGGGGGLEVVVPRPPSYFVLELRFQG